MTTPDFTAPSAPAARRSKLDRFLTIIERGGNALPHPATLFAILAGLVLVMSWLLSELGLAVQHPTTGATVRVVNLLSIEGLHRILTQAVTNFTSFAPLGTVLVALIGIGVAEHSGLIGAALRMLVLSSPRVLLTPMLVFAGVMSNMASEIGYVLLVPLAGLIFKAAGRHPIVGMAAAFAGVSGGYSANLLIGTIDPLLSGLSQEAARIIDPEAIVTPVANWYFMMASTPMVTALGWVVTEKVVAKRFPDQAQNETSTDEEVVAQNEPHGRDADGAQSETSADGVVAEAPAQGEAPADGDMAEPSADPQTQRLSPAEKRGLRWAAVAAGVLTLVLVWAVLPAGSIAGAGFLRNPVDGDLLNSPALSGVVAIVFVYGVITGITYGIVAGTIKNDSDVIEGMSRSMSTLGGYLVLVFFAAQFVAFFNWTQLGLVLAVNGANLLQAMQLPAVPLFLCFILLTAVVNLFMGSASAKWALMAPVFVPMFLLLGYSPELTQAAYRIGDSATNIISPMMSYFALIIAFFQRYEPRTGIGTLVAVMLPYSVTFLLGWSMLFCLWLALGLPMGPGAGLLDM